MSNFERLFTLEPRHFPLPTLPFRSDFNGYGVGAKVRLEATPYASSQSGFEICLLESGDDVAFHANVSFDSEWRSAIDVKSRFEGKWSPTVRQIAIGVAIDRAFVLEITINSSEFAVTVDGFKVIELVKRCDDVKTVLVTGAILVKEITIFPSLLYYTPPPQYQNETDEEVDMNSALKKLALIPTAPDATPSNTLFNKFRLEEHIQPTYKSAIVVSAPTGSEENLGLQESSTRRLAPPRPPPPKPGKHPLPPFSSNDVLPHKISQKPSSTTGIISESISREDIGDFTRSSSQTSCLYPNINKGGYVTATVVSKPLAYINNGDTDTQYLPSMLPSQSDGIIENEGADLQQYRHFNHYASGRAVDYQSKQNIIDFARTTRIYQSTAHRMGQRQCAPSSGPCMGSASNFSKVRNHQARSGSYENLRREGDAHLRPSRSDAKRRPQQRPLTTMGISSSMLNAQQLQQKTEAVYKAAKNFVKANLIKGSRSAKQVIRTSFVEPQVLTLVGTLIPGAKKFEVGLVHADDYIMLFSARDDQKCIVLNSTHGGIWQEEERVHRFPFNNEQSFMLEFYAGNPLQIFVNGNFFCEFRLRCGLPIDAIKIDNNLRLQQFQIK